LVIAYIADLQFVTINNYNTALITVIHTSLLSLLQSLPGYSLLIGSIPDVLAAFKLHSLTANSRLTAYSKLTFYNASAWTAQKTPLPTALLLLCVQLLLRSHDGYRPFPSNSHLCCRYATIFKEIGRSSLPYQ
jgi:hypothetical protein